MHHMLLRQQSDPASDVSSAELETLWSTVGEQLLTDTILIPIVDKF